MKMNWTDILDELKRRNGEQGDIAADDCREPAHTNAVILTGNPEVKIYRQKKNINSFSTPHGNCSYDPYGSLLMSISDPYPDAIYTDTIFFTRATCKVTLSEQYSLSMKPNKFYNIKNLFKKTPDKTVYWSVKTDLSEVLVTKLLNFLKCENQECIERISIQLELICQLTSDRFIHNLTVTTDILPDNLNKFCLLNDFYPLRQDGRNLSDFETALFLVENMVHCCRSIYFALLENEK